MYRNERELRLLPAAGVVFRTDVRRRAEVVELSTPGYAEEANKRRARIAIEASVVRANREVR